MAKLEARMVGKASSASATATQSQPPTTWPAATKIAGLPENMACEPLSSDSDDDGLMFFKFFLKEMSISSVELLIYGGLLCGGIVNLDSGDICKTSSEA